MNNKGQVLVIFVVLLPLVLGLFGYVVDKCYLLNQKNTLNHLIDDTCSYSLSNVSDKEVEDYILKNDSKVKIKKLTRKNSSSTITLEKEVNSIFGKILGMDTYTVKTSVSCIE